MISLGVNLLTFGGVFKKFPILFGSDFFVYEKDIFFYLYAEAQPAWLNDEVILKNGLYLSD